MKEAAKEENERRKDDRQQLLRSGDCNALRLYPTISENETFEETWRENCMKPRAIFTWWRRSPTNYEQTMRSSTFLWKVSRRRSSYSIARSMKKTLKSSSSRNTRYRCTMMCWRRITSWWSSRKRCPISSLIHHQRLAKQHIIATTTVNVGHDHRNLFSNRILIIIITSQIPLLVRRDFCVTVRRVFMAWFPQNANQTLRCSWLKLSISLIRQDNF